MIRWSNFKTIELELIIARMFKNEWNGRLKKLTSGIQ